MALFLLWIAIAIIMESRNQNESIGVNKMKFHKTTAVLWK